MKMNKTYIFLFTSLFFSSICQSQVTLTDYQRADSTIKLRDLAYYTRISSHWIDETSSFWYTVNTPKGDEYFLVDATKLKKLSAFDQQKLCKNLNAVSGKDFKPFAIPLKELTFNKNLNEIEFIIDSIKWNCNLKNYVIKKVEDVKIPAGSRRYWGESPDELSNEPVISPDSTWMAFIKNYNVFIKKRKTERRVPVKF